MQLKIRAASIVLGMLAALCAPTVASAQDFSGTPASDHQSNLFGYRVIDADPYIVIYPPGAEEAAQRTARMLLAYTDQISSQHGHGSRKIPIIIYSELADVNGFVSPAPFHSGFFTGGFTTRTPGTMFYGIPWTDLLAVHEGRHMVQISHVRRGLTRVAHGLFGPSGESLFLLLSNPNWVLEGDAVLAETAYTRAGRGRSPGFNLALDLALADRPDLSFDDLRLGSYKRHMPSHYPYGYHLVKRGNERFGPEKMVEVTTRSSRVPIIPWSYSFFFKRVNGQRFREFARQTFDELKRQLDAQREATPMTTARALTDNTKSRFWSRHASPALLDDGSVISSFSRRDRAPQLVRISKDGDVTRLTGVQGGTSHVSAGGDIACVSETVPALRVTMKSRSQLRCVDVTSGRDFTLARGGRLLSPAVSRAGDQVAAIDYSPRQRAQIVIFDAASGEETQRVTLDAQHNAADLSFNSDGSLTFIETTLSAGDRVMRLVPGDASAEILWENGFELIWQPRIFEGHLVYGGAHTGVSALWARALDGGAPKLIAARPFGAYRFDVRDDQVVFEEPRVGGTILASVAWDPDSWIGLESIPDVSLSVWTPEDPETPARDAVTSAHEPHTSDTHSDDHAPLESRRYRPRDATRLTSWFPVLSPLTGDTELVGAGLEAANLLGTWTARASAAYELKSRTPRGEASIALPSLPIIPEVRASAQTSRATTSKEDEMGEPYSVDLSWREARAGGGLTLPLSLPTTTFSSSLTSYVGVSRRWFSGVPTDAGVDFLPTADGARTEVQAGTTFFMMRTGRVNGRRGLIANAQLAATPFGGVLAGDQWGGSATAMLPGVVGAHTLSVSGGLQHRDDGSFPYAPFIELPFAYRERPSGYLTAGRLDYDIPLLFPDWGWVIVGVARISVGAFVEGASSSSAAPVAPLGTLTDGDDWLTAAGGRLTLDVVPFRAPLTLNVGLEAGMSYSPAGSEPFISPVFNLGL